MASTSCDAAAAGRPPPPARRRVADAAVADAPGRRAGHHGRGLPAGAVQRPRRQRGRRGACRLARPGRRRARGHRRGDGRAARRSCSAWLGPAIGAGAFRGGRGGARRRSWRSRSGARGGLRGATRADAGNATCPARAPAAAGARRRARSAAAACAPTRPGAVLFVPARWQHRAGMRRVWPDWTTLDMTHDTLAWIVAGFTAARRRARAPRWPVPFLLLPERRRARLLPHLVSFATGALLGRGAAGAAARGRRGRRPGTRARRSASRCSAASRCSSCWRNWCCGATAIRGLRNAMRPARSSASRPRRAACWCWSATRVHNALDGVLIAAAFLTDMHLGVVTALAIMAHEVPQEVGDFAVLLHSGMSRGRALSVEPAEQPDGSVLGGAARLLRAARGAAGCCPMRMAVAAASCSTWPSPT